VPGIRTCSDIELGHGSYYMRPFEAAAASLAITTMVAPVRNAEEIERVISRLDASDLQHRTQSLLCSNGDIAHTIKEKGFSYEYHYVDKERVSLATFTIADCP
jgi:hypothetical protein